MRILTRHSGEGILIKLSDDIDPTTPVGEVLAEPININVICVEKEDQVRLGISANRGLNIVHKEILYDAGLPDETRLVSESERVTDGSSGGGR